MRFVLQVRDWGWRSTALASLLLLTLPQLHGQAVSEYQVKAAYLYNFAKFVEWPAETFASPASPFEFCVLNDRTFADELIQTVKGKMVAGRGVNVLSVKSADEARGCHILFISSTQRAQAGIIEALRDTNVLTVGESEGFMEHGGIINFILQDSRVQFQVNHRAANQARLQISARLLGVAKLVIR